MKKILLDIGGTFIKCSDGREIPVNSAGTSDEICASLRDAVGDYDCVRAAIPGPFDYATGHFMMKHKFAAVYGKYFQDIVGVQDCRFIHDVNCMLLGEMTAGNGKGYGKVAIIALGTGLGFSMSIDGKILKNELGSPEVSIFKRPYRDGILEDYASKRGIYRLYGDDSVTVKEIGRRAVCGEERAKEAFAQMGSILGEAVAPIMKEYEIECLLLGGQISHNSSLFAPQIQAELSKLGLDLSITPISDFGNATFCGLENI